MYLIDVKNATVSYPSDDGGTRVILDDLTLKVRRGELVTVVGPSGCGKSTLLRLILGSQFPNSGTVLVDGKQVERVTRDCGIVYQNYSLFPHLTVLDNVALGPLLEHTGPVQRMLCWPLHGLSRWQGPRKALETFKYFRILRQARQKAGELLAQCGLDPAHHGEKYPFELSGGMRQRVAIAQALIMEPKILLMDEPFGALDYHTRESMQDFIHEQWSRHKITVFFVTHDLEEACKIGTRLVCLSQYWRRADGKDGAGARFLIDKKVVGGAEKPSRFVHSDEFKTLVEDIRHRALNRENRQPLSSFELTHEDAFRLEASA
jgi:NitT/TauT family transport system ATP-binding protein